MSYHTRSRRSLKLKRARKAARRKTARLLFDQVMVMAARQIGLI